MMATGGPPDILLVEDDPDDVLLVKLALDMTSATIALRVVNDGDAAVAYLRGIGRDGAHSPLPRLILLDLKLPRRSGHEVLEWLRGQPGLRRVPVIVLSSSARQQDIDRAYDLGVNSYLVKPVQLQAFADTLADVVKYWTQVNCAPNPREDRDRI